MPWRGELKKGRPVISFRLSESQLSEVDHVCQKFNWSRSEYFQNSINILINYWRALEAKAQKSIAK